MSKDSIGQRCHACGANIWPLDVESFTVEHWVPNTDDSEWDGHNEFVIAFCAPCWKIIGEVAAAMELKPS